MTTTWTVGIDGSPDACAALAWATAIAADTAGVVVPLTAWHVPLPIRLAVGRRAIEVDRLGLEAEAAVLLAHTVDAADDPTGVIGEAVVVEEHAAPALLERSRQGDTLVVGRRGASDLKHRLLGSVSQYLATHAAGPVVVVPHTWKGSRCTRIVVGFDGSDHSMTALRWAMDIAPDDATVTALISLDVIPWVKPEAAADRYPDEVVAAERRIRDAAHRVDPDHRVERRVVHHGPRQMLGEASLDADLVVVGPRGIGGAARAILGSVSTWLLHEAPCPVAVIPTND